MNRLGLNPQGWQHQLLQGEWPASRLLLLSEVTPADEDCLQSVPDPAFPPLVLLGPEEQFSPELCSRALAVLPEADLNDSVLALLQRLARLEHQNIDVEQDLPPNPLQHLDFITAGGLPGGLYQSRMEADGRFWFNYVAPVTRQLFGLAPDQSTLPGDVLSEMVAAEDLDRVQAAIHTAVTELTLYREMVHMTGRQGQAYWLECIAYPQREADGAVQLYGLFIDRTEEYTARQNKQSLERELRVRQQLQERLLELIPSSYSIFNLATQTLEAIPVADLASSFGLTEGKRADDILQSLLHTDDRQRWKQELARTRTLADGEVMTSELRYRNAQGDYSPIRTWAQVLERDDSGQPLRVATISADLSWLRSMESQLEQAWNALDVVLGETGTLYYCDPLDSTRQGPLTYYSPGLSELLGLASLAHSGEIRSALLELMHPDDRPVYQTRWTAGAALPVGHRWTNTLRLRQADGQYRWYCNQGSLICDREGVLYYQGIAFDITKFQETQQALEEASRAKDRFLAQMSHELRTPLTAMLSLAQNLAEGIYGELPTEAANKLQLLQQSGKHLLSLIEDLLDYGRIASGDMPCQRTALNPEHLGRDALALVQHLAVEKGVQMRLIVPFGDRHALLDARLIRQLLVNLLQNAIRFSGHGDLIDLEVGWLPAGDLVLAVRDQGPGTGLI